MNINQTLGAMLLGSRLKKLGEKLTADIQAIYTLKGIKFSTRVFPAIVALNSAGSCGVVELARILGVTHAAASQMVKNLHDLKLVQLKTDKHDDRRSIASLTSHGKHLLKNSEPVCKEIRKTIEHTIAQIAPHFLQTLSQLESEFEKNPISSKITQNHKQKSHQEAGSGI